MSSKYTTIASYLRGQQGESLRLSFEEVDEIMGGLPDAAWRHRAWWANNHSFTHARHGWLKAGWKTAKVDMDRQELSFVRQLPSATLGSTECLCGCGGTPQAGDFLPGHDQRLRTSIEASAGGIANLWQVASAIDSYLAGEIIETELAQAIRRHWRSPSLGGRTARIQPGSGSSEAKGASLNAEPVSLAHDRTRDPSERRKLIVERLLEISRGLEPTDLLPAVFPAASEFAQGNPYAFSIAACLDRQTKAEVIWTIPYDMQQALEHLDPEKIGSMSLPELHSLFARLPRKPRYVNDAPQTVAELTRLVLDEAAGDAANLWKNKTASQVRATFLKLHGVGPGIANMIVLLLERIYGIRFSDLDHTAMDIKPDVHTTRVLYRLGVSEAVTAEAAVDGARRLNPEYPGEIDGALWRIGRGWCHALTPECHACPMSDLCPRVGLGTEP